MRADLEESSLTWYVDFDGYKKQTIWLVLLERVLIIVFFSSDLALVFDERVPTLETGLGSRMLLKAANTIGIL